MLENLAFKSKVILIAGYTARACLMKKETRQIFKDLGYYSHLGFSIALAIFIGLFIGLWIDKVFGTQPVFMFIFLILGIMAGFNNIYRAVKRSEKEK